MRIDWADKFCPRCKTVKPRCEWGRNRSRPDGLDWCCRKCARERKREWKKSNPGKAAMAADVVSKREKRRRAARAKTLAGPYEPSPAEIAAESKAIRDKRLTEMAD